VITDSNQASRIGGFVTAHRDATLITQHNISEEDGVDEESGVTEESGLDTSNISGLESLKNTKNSRTFYRSKQVHGRVDVDNRSPVSNIRGNGFKKMHEESLSMTPDSQLNS